MKTIVVGSDGSEGGWAALAFAAEEASMRHARLLVVTAWHTPPLVLAGVVAESGYYEDAVAEARQHALAVASDAVARVKEMAPSVECEAEVVEGQAAKAILEEAEDAVLLVVGSRGHGGFSGLLLGSTSQQVVQHAKCPVVVVPAEALE